MNKKVTKNTVSYPEGLEPNIIVPEDYRLYRYIIGREGKSPFVAMCMNPSAARDDKSDRTVNRVIRIGQELGYDGWVVFNIYPERATDSGNLEDYDEGLSEDNVKSIREYIIDNDIKEVWGAWGDLNCKTLRRAREDIFKMFEELGVNIFYFGSLTKKGNPRHPIQRFEKWTISHDAKNVLDI